MSRIEISGAAATIYPDAPDWDGRKTASFGEFSCDSARDGARLLEKIERRLEEEGFEALIGPMDGDTWHKYRVVTESDGSAPFLMEPVSGAHDLAAMREAGFAPVSNYFSTRAPLKTATSRKPARLRGVRVSHWDGKDGERLLAEFFAMSRQAFAGNRFYKPLGKEEFAALYAPVIPLIDPRFILLAHNSHGDFTGYLFAIPNHLEGEKPRSIIIKTYASRQFGVGHVLGDALHRYALEQGFEQVIHALMHESNSSLRQSRKYGASVMRRYALMGKLIGKGARP
jgi:hypothetical protein